MFKKIVFLFLILFTALLQVSFLGALTGAGPTLNLLLVPTLILAFRGWEKESYLYAFLGGFFLDWLSLQETVGLTGVFLVLALIFWGTVKRLTAPRGLIFLLFVFLASWLSRAAGAYPWSLAWFFPSLTATGGDVLLTILALPLLTTLFRYLLAEGYWQLDFRNRL